MSEDEKILCENEDRGCYNCSYCDGDDMRCVHPEHTTNECMCEDWDG